MGNVAEDRRSDSRSATVFKPILIRTDSFAGFCLMRNLSSMGLMGKVYTEFAVGTAVAIQFDSETIVSGEIVWSKDGTVGVCFYEEIVVADMLTLGLGAVVGRKAFRAPRLAMQDCAEIEIDGQSHQVEVLDVSQRGAKVNATFLEPGDEALLVLNGLEPRRVMVRWTRSGTAGLNFRTMLSLEQLAAWVIMRQEPQAHEHESEFQSRRGSG